MLPTLSGASYLNPPLALPDIFTVLPRESGNIETGVSAAAGDGAERSRGDSLLQPDGDVPVVSAVRV